MPICFTLVLVFFVAHVSAAKFTVAQKTNRKFGKRWETDKNRETSVN